MKTALSILLLSLLLSPVPAIAADKHDHDHDHEHDHHQHDAHVHGEAHLQLVMEADMLEMELQAPAQDIVGFEHTAKNDNERQRVADAISQLEDGETLFRFEGTSCALQQTKATQHNSKGGHAEFHSHYRFRCEQPGGLLHIDVQLARHFNGIGRIHAEWILGSRQGARTLGKDKHRIEVK